MTKPDPIEELARRAAGGDRVAFDGLVERFGPRIAAFVRTRLGKQMLREVDAEDIVQDVFLNVVGGLRVTETSADLAAIAAVISSFRERALPNGLIVMGEVGLSGEIRLVSSGQERIAEAAKHGFTQAIVPVANMPRQPIKGIEVKGIKKLVEMLDLI